MKFNIEFTKRAVKELKKLPIQTQKIILKESLVLESDPFQFKKKIKRIKGFKFPCYRLRVDTSNDSYRLFYGIDKDIIYILRIISKKDADKIISRLRSTEFPPES